MPGQNTVSTSNIAWAPLSSKHAGEEDKTNFCQYSLSRPGRKAAPGGSDNKTRIMRSNLRLVSAWSDRKNYIFLKNNFLC